MRYSALLGFTLLVALMPAALGAQEGSKLRKSDIVRVLTGTTYSKAEIASMVRRNCLAFVPTSRDREDLRELGATPAIFEQIDQCVRKGNRPDAPTPPPPRPVELVVVDRASSAPSGSVAYISVELRRGASPVRGERLVIRGARGIPGGARTDPTAVTDSRGRATFAVPAGTRAGSYHLNVAAADGSALLGSGAVTLTTLPASNTLARISPDVIPLGRGPAQRAIAVTLTDPFGNPVAGRDVELRPSTTRANLAPQTRQTSDSGTVTFEISASALRSGDSLVVASDGRTLGVVSVSAAAEVSSRLVEAARLSAAGDPGAEEAYTRVLTMDPGNADALLGRGFVRSRAGQYDEARADFESALREDPAARADALTGMGYNAARRGDYPAAAEHFRAALAARPNDDAATTGLALAELWQSDSHQAARRLEVLNSALTPAYPSSAAEELRAGVRQLAGRELVAAERALSVAVDSAPGWPDAYYNRALAYEAGGKTDRARADFQRYLQLRPAAADRGQVAKHITALEMSPSGALLRGLAVPGFGQFYTGRRVLGGLLLAAVAGSTVWALQEKRTVEVRTYPDPFGGTDTLRVPVRERPNFTAGLATAGGLWLLGALEASLHVQNARGGIPLPLPLPEGWTQDTAQPGPSGGDSGSGSAERAMLRPTVSFQPWGPRFGAAVSIPFR